MATWTDDKHWVLYSEVISPELHAHLKQLDESAQHVMHTLEHARHRTVTCLWQDEQQSTAPLHAAAMEAPAVCRSPPQEPAKPSAAVASQPKASSSWQADWSEGALTVGSC